MAEGLYPIGQGQIIEVHNVDLSDARYAMHERAVEVETSALATEINATLGSLEPADTVALDEKSSLGELLETLEKPPLLGALLRDAEEWISPQRLIERINGFAWVWVGEEAMSDTCFVDLRVTERPNTEGIPVVETGEVIETSEGPQSVVAPDPFEYTRRVDDARLVKPRLAAALLHHAAATFALEHRATHLNVPGAFSDQQELVRDCGFEQIGQTELTHRGHTLILPSYEAVLTDTVIAALNHHATTVT